MYPREIANILAQQGLGWDFAENLNACQPGRSVEPGVVADWLIRNEGGHPEIAAYLGYLRACRRRFGNVVNSMGYWNAQSSHGLGHDKWSVGWGGDGLLPIAAYLYALRSHGLSGNLLECGAFKGSSTACLSIACDLLGTRLFCADSFEGLPDGEAHYAKGDFYGGLDEVRGNVERYGEIGRVSFIPGWYRESLAGFSENISILWMDVDLRSSTLDVLENVLPALEPGGVIFSDGLAEGVDFEGKRIKQIGHPNAGLCEPAGFYEFFANSAIEYQAIPAGPRGLALVVPGIDESVACVFDAQDFARLIDQLGDSAD
jgi:hypothetical protein